MDTLTQKKIKLLGMNPRTAKARLMKNVLFNVLKGYGINYCSLCEREIERAHDLSLRHKEPWFTADDPKKTFFDISNVMISCFWCNRN